MPSRPLTENERALIDNALKCYAEASCQSANAAATVFPHAGEERLRDQFIRQAKQIEALREEIENVEVITIGVE